MSYVISRHVSNLFVTLGFLLYDVNNDTRKLSFQINPDVMVCVEGVFNFSSNFMRLTNLEL
jgi:hypothetical protein